MPTLRMSAEMTLWGRKVKFIFSGLSDGGYIGQLEFPDRISIGDVMRNAWKEIMPEDDFPFGDIGLEIKSVMAMMKDSTDGRQSIVQFEIIIDSIKLSVYFIKDNEKHTSATVFAVTPQQAFQIETLPGVNTKLEDPITAALAFYIATDDIDFTVGSVAKTFKKGLAISCKLEVGDIFKTTLDYAHTPQKNKEKNKEKSNKNGIISRSADSADTKQKTAKVKWKQLDKKLGKVTIHRIGFLYANNEVNLLFDISANFSILQISLIGFKMGVKVKQAKNLKYIPYFRYLVVPPSLRSAEAEEKINLVKDVFSFGLNGLGIASETKAFTIGGILAKQEIEVNNKFYTQYAGGLVLKTKAFTVNAIGAYGDIDGYKSFFLYAFLGVPLGGPPFFFVNGLALGFGYNRMVKIPHITGVADFPLVSIALSKPDKETSLIERLTKMIVMIGEAFPPMQNRYFVAIGIKFMSFKLLDGFLLLIVSFGGKLRFDILGLFVLAMPKDDPVAFLEIALKVTVIPDDGIIKVDGLITENSYIFSKKARLQGGFAFYAWAKDIEDNGEQVDAGDFVLTIGGYHPRYRKPAHYPDVPRFGINWQVSSKMSVKALAYFALTSNAVMAGAELSAVYQSDTVYAAFKLWADFLIQWKPFFYDIEIGIEIALTYRGIGFELGAQVRVWGPEFSGKAKVKLSLGFFKVSKTISFGDADKPTVLKIKWSEFNKEFLPGKEAVISLQVAEGLLNESEGIFKVNPKDLGLKVESLIPVSEVSIFKQEKFNGEKEFGIYPVMDARHAYSKMKWKLYYIPEKKASENDTESNALSTEVEWVYKNLPAALWSNEKEVGMNTDKPMIFSLVGGVVKAKAPQRGKPVDVVKIPDYQLIHIEEGWSWQDLDFFSKATKEYELRTDFGFFKESFQAKTTDWSDFALKISNKDLTEVEL